MTDPSDRKTPTTARFKLQFPQSVTDETASQQEEELIKFFSRYYYNVERDGERIEVGGAVGGVDTIRESSFVIKSSDGFKSDLISPISLFQKYLGNFAPIDRSTLVFSEKKLFENKIICELRDVPVSRVYFGNIFENTFYNHWQVSFRNTSGAETPLKNSKKRQNPEPTLRKLKVDFDFDRPTPILVTYRLRETRQNGKSKWDVYATYQMSVDGDSIERILVHSRDKQLRVYFILRTPVILKRRDEDVRSGRKQSAPWKRILQLWWGDHTGMTSSRSVLTENLIFCLELSKDPDFNPSQLYSILSRLRSRWNFTIEFTAINDHKMNNKGLLEKWDSSPYFIRGCPLGDESFAILCQRLFPFVKSTGSVRNKEKDRINERKFTYVYLIMALLSRGSIVKDQLILVKENWVRFLNIIETHFYNDKYNDLCESALEDLLRYVDSTSRVGNLLQIFETFCIARQQSGTSNQLTKEQWGEGYRKVRKVVITPTRLKFFVPETIMANRAMTAYDHDGTRIIRAIFRDDNGGNMQLHRMHHHLKETVLASLRLGFTICDRPFGYLGSSSSQMRNAGAYFMERYSKKQGRSLCETYKVLYPPPGYKPKIFLCRKQLGDFDEVGSVPLVMARFGLTLTQARVCNIDIYPRDYTTIPDVCGGKNANGDPYTFSDGVGKISPKLAWEISRDFKFPNNFVPSVFQFRFRGFKGVLQVDPKLDEVADIKFGKLKILFRKSQSKFSQRVGDGSAAQIEIVKWSAPTPVTLNRPFINILDQVSAAQSLPCHKRICGRIEQLLDGQLDAFTSWIINERSCRAKLEEMPRRIHFSYLNETYGFTLSTEPFFRSLIKAAVDVSMMRLLNKIQIQIPGSLGRSMFGVTDDTGQLQYGQVFFQYTDNMSKKCPHKTTPKTVHTGKVLVTKFPSTVPGDVRLFEAVDIPGLRHLENVIVFPQSGPRPHPDEMAGSDLDGDEYAIIWDPQLFFERNEEAFEYCSEKPRKEFNKEELDNKMHDFFVEYMQQEGVGHIANNHLYQSDQYGLDAEVCTQLAKKGSMALDYSKSGVAPERLTHKWTYDSKTGKQEPPEQAQRIPDFSGQQFKPMYTSPRLLGTLFRGLRSVYAVVDSSTNIQPDIVPDEALICPGWETFVAGAKRDMARYNAQLRSLMDNAGVRSEAEVFSGCIREMRNRHQDQKNDELSIFNAEHILESSVTALFKSFREQFFAEFYNNRPNAYMKFTEPEHMNPRFESDETEDVLKRVCRKPSADIMAKAVAYYRVCYDSNTPARGDRMLSFGWIAFDVLNYIKREHLMDLEKLPEPRYPQFEAIFNHRQRYHKKNKGKRPFYKLLNRTPTDNVERNAVEAMDRYIDNYRGLENVLCVIDAWARAANLLKNKLKTEDDISESSLKWYHLSLLFIMFAKNEIGFKNENVENNIPRFEDIKPNERLTNPKRLTNSDLDRLTFAFFGFLSSRNFRSIPRLNFTSFGVSSVFSRGEWIPYHKLAIKTYYNILLNTKFDDFPDNSQPYTKAAGEDLEDSIREGCPFTIELPKGVNELEIYEILKRKSKCSEVEGRKETRGENINDRLLISSRGTVEALQDLRDLAAIQIPRYSWLVEQDASRSLALLSYYKITGHRWDDEEQQAADSKENVRPNTISSTGNSQSSPGWLPV